MRSKLAGETSARAEVELEELGAPTRGPHTAPRPAGGGRVAALARRGARRRAGGAQHQPGLRAGA